MKSLLRLPTLILLSLVLLGCETNLSTDELRIVNASEIISEMIYYQSVDIPIEIAGGQGGYSVRYIQNPEEGMSEKIIDGAIANNPIDLTVIKDTSTQKDTFRLQGMPLPISSNILSDLETQFWLEVTDGNTTYIEKFELDVVVPTLERYNSASQFLEGRASSQGIGDGLAKSYKFCPEALSKSYEPVNRLNGLAYPLAIVLRISDVLSVPVELQYEVEEIGSAGNSAVGNVDFVQEGGVVTIPAGYDSCAIVVYIMDDNEVEGRENFVVRVEDAGNLVARFESLQIRMTIDDDEPSLRLFDEKYVLSPGQSRQLGLSLGALPTKEVFVPYRMLAEESSLAEEFFVTDPQSRLVSFETRNRNSSFNFLLKNEAISLTQDRVVILEFPGPSTSTRKSQIRIVANAFNSKTVLSSDQAVEFLKIASFSEGVYALAKIEDGSGTVRSRLYRLNAQGGMETLDGNFYKEFSTLGYDVKPIDLAVIDEEDTYTELMMLLETSDNFGGLVWGGQDFVLARMKIDKSGNVSDLVLQQHGSEEDDYVNGLHRNVDSGEVFVFGNTTGKSLDGEAVIAAEGLNDGFVYRFSGIGSLEYRRFLGDQNENTVHSLFDEGGVLRAVISTDKGFYTETQDEDGNKDSDSSAFQLVYPEAYDFGGLANTRSSTYLVPISSVHGGDNLGFSPSLSKDVYVVELTFGGEVLVRNLFSIASPQDEDVVDLAQVESQKFIAVVGDTSGELAGEGSQIGGKDGFLASIAYEGTARINKVTQFGTPGDDFVLDVEAVNDEKFLVLWKENHTSGDGSFRYRITPFAPDGTNLVPLF